MEFFAPDPHGLHLFTYMSWSIKIAVIGLGLEVPDKNPSVCEGAIDGESLTGGRVLNSWAYEFLIVLWIRCHSLNGQSPESYG